MKIPLLLLLVLIPVVASAQKLAGNFQEVTARTGLSLEDLDKEYQSALHSNPELAVFNGQEEEFIEAYKNMLTELATFLKEKGFQWEKTSRCFNRIYLSADGKIEYFLYNFRSGEISAEKEQQFKSLLSQFIEGYQFPLTAEVKFAQCSPVTYQDL